MWLPSSVQASLAGSLREQDRYSKTLTARETEIVRYAAMGLRSTEIAHKLFIAEHTVKTHLNNVFRKLGIHDRVQLTLYAIQTGLVSPRDREST